MDLEDHYEDILTKAMLGWRMGRRQLAEASGRSVVQVQDALDGKFTEADARAFARHLHLDADALIRLATGAYPKPPPAPAGLMPVTTRFQFSSGDWGTVNSYLVRVPRQSEGVLFDTATDPEAILSPIRAEGLSISSIFLTHTHPDHIAVLPHILPSLGHPPVYVHENEHRKGWTAFSTGAEIRSGKLKIEARLTDGHTAGGTTFVIEGLALPVAIVGDSLFAGSQGGAGTAWPKALQNNREQILSLPDETILAPGHGPLTTVENEKAHNPCFAGDAWQAPLEIPR